MNKISLLVAALSLFGKSVPTSIHEAPDSKPLNLGRREEKDRIALAKAAAKRQRKMEKARRLAEK